jgi:hypothetical protein
MTPERRILHAIKSAQDILARHVEPGGPDAMATIDALLNVLDDTDVVEATHDFAPAVILQDLYDSEINYTVSTFWDAGFRVMLGDDMNGFVAENRVQTFTEAVQWLALAAIEHYPQSDFSKKYRT